MPRTPKKRTDGSPEAAEWNALIDLLTSVIPQAAVGTLYAQTPHGTARTASPGSSTGRPGLSRHRLKAVQDDYLECMTWNGTTEGTVTVPIAKRPKLRCSLESAVIFGSTVTYSYTTGLDSLNIIRAAWDGTTTENQVVIPHWLTNDEIWALPASTGITTTDGLTLPIAFLDCGDSRQWAAIVTT